MPRQVHTSIFRGRAQVSRISRFSADTPAVRSGLFAVNCRHHSALNLSKAAQDKGRTQSEEHGVNTTRLGRGIRLWDMRNSNILVDLESLVFTLLTSIRSCVLERPDYPIDANMIEHECHLESLLFTLVSPSLCTVPHV